MGSHPINLTVRFLLEIATLVALGYWGWHHGQGMLRLILAIGIPLIAAVLWGTFAVPDDPSRSGNAPIPVPGVVRLVLELAFFGLGVWALYSSGLIGLSLVLGGVTIVHYLVSYDRILWLIQQYTKTT